MFNSGETKLKRVKTHFNVAVRSALTHFTKKIAKNELGLVLKYFP